ncbi:MAG: TonB-dependent receptor, partial [Soonwooa sp.]
MTPLAVFSQINLKVLDEDGNAVGQAKVTYNNQEYQTDNKGFIKIPLGTEVTSLSVEKEDFKSFTKQIPLTPKTQNLNVLFIPVTKVNEIKEVVFQKKIKPKSNDLSSVEISPREAQIVASLSGGVEGLIKTLPQFNSNTELSSQYMVRGGNYDENLIYINDIEIYRPFLVRNSL